MIEVVERNTMTEFDPIAAAEATTERGAFSFMDRLLGRNMPKDEVVVYLDEASGYRIQSLEKRLAHTSNPEQVKALEDEILELRKLAAQSKYTFRLEAIPAEEYDALILEAQAEYPVEYDTQVNPLSNEVIRYEVENSDRQELINNKVWAAFIREIEDPSGLVDANVNVPTAAVLRKKLPLAAKDRISRKIISLRMASDWMERLQDESFFHTP